MFFFIYFWRGRGGDCRRCEVAQIKERLPLSRMSLTATWNLPDCSTDALQLCTNYAKWPNWLLLPSSAWCARLWMHCPIPFAFFNLVYFLWWGTTPDVFFSLYETNQLSEFWTFHFFVFGFVLFLILYSGTRCVCVGTFWTITGAFFLSYFSWYVFFAVSAVRLLKLFTICRDSHFFGEDFIVEPDFVKALLYWPFLIHACCSYDLNNKTCCWISLVWSRILCVTDSPTRLRYTRHKK